jgi:hypothetical protein
VRGAARAGGAAPDAREAADMVAGAAAGAWAQGCRRGWGGQRRGGWRREGWRKGGRRHGGRRGGWNFTLCPCSHINKLPCPYHSSLLPLPQSPLHLSPQSPPALLRPGRTWMRRQPLAGLSIHTLPLSATSSDDAEVDLLRCVSTPRPPVAAASCCQRILRVIQLASSQQRNSLQSSISSSKETISFSLSKEQ